MKLTEKLISINNTWYRDLSLLINSIDKNCFRQQTLISLRHISSWQSSTQSSIGYSNKEKYCHSNNLNPSGRFLFYQINKWTFQKNLKIAFLLLALLPGFNLFIHSLKLRFLSELTSILKSIRLHITFKNLIKWLVALKSLSIFEVLTKPLG